MRKLDYLRGPKARQARLRRLEQEIIARETNPQSEADKHYDKKLNELKDAANLKQVVAAFSLQGFELLTKLFEEGIEKAVTNNLERVIDKKVTQILEGATQGMQVFLNSRIRNTIQEQHRRFRIVRTSLKQSENISVIVEPTIEEQVIDTEVSEPIINKQQIDNEVSSQEQSVEVNETSEQITIESEEQKQDQESFFFARKKQKRAYSRVNGKTQLDCVVEYFKSHPNQKFHSSAIKEALKIEYGLNPANITDVLTRAKKFNVLKVGDGYYYFNELNDVETATGE